MKSTLLNILATAMLASTTIAIPATGPVCRIACLNPSTHDPHAIPTNCNCAEKQCPLPSGPGGPNIPFGKTWAFNATSDTCGPISNPQDECTSLQIQCIANFTYTWESDSSACKCVENSIIINKREAGGEICDLACLSPERYDAHAISPGCNCADRVCPVGVRPCPVDESWGWDQEADSCGCVISVEAGCEAVGVSCLSGYKYGWSAADAACECLAN